MGEVKVLCGPPGCGKTEEVVRRFVGQVQAAGLDSAVLLVPTSRIVREISRRLLADGSLRGLVDARILTFPQLADQLLRANHALAPELSPLQREMLMRLVINTIAAHDGLRALATCARTPGLARALLGLIDELKRAAIRPDELAAGLKKVGLNRPLDRELRAIYRRYQALLADRALYDAAGKFWEARDLLRDGQIAPFQGMRHLFVDGFADFTTTELQVLTHLASFAEATVITLPYSPDERRDEVRWLPEQTLRRIRSDDMMPAAVCEPVLPGEPCDDALAFVRRHLFALAPPAAPDGCAKQVRLTVADSIRAELRAIATQVKTLLLDGVAPADICVSFRQPHRHRDLIGQVFGECGVPYHFSAEDNIAGQPLVQLVMSLLRIATGDCDRNDIISFLRSEAADLRCLQNEQGEPDSDTVFAVACRAGIVRGRDQWSNGLRLYRQRLLRHLTAIRQRRDVDELDDDLRAMTDPERVEAELRRVEAVENLLSRLLEQLDRLPRAATLSEHISALLRLMESFGLSPDSLTEGAAAVWLSRDNLRAFDSFCEALWECKQIAGWQSGRQPVALAEFIEQLAVLVRAVRFRPDQQEQGRVRVLDVYDNLRQMRVPYLFIADLVQGAFPLVDRDEVFYSEDERALLSEQAGFHLRTRPGNEMAEAFLFHEAVSAATKQLHLSHTAFGNDGNPVLPSQYFEEVKRLLGADASAVCHAATRADDSIELVCGIRQLREGVFSGMFAGDRPGAGEEEVLAGYNLLCEIDPAVTPRAAQAALAEAGRYSRDPFDAYDGILDDKRLIAQLSAQWGDQHIYSASQLSAYGSCPFRFYLERVLRLESVTEPDDEPDRAARGSLAHRILSRFMNEWINDDSHPAALLEDDLEEAQDTLRRVADEVFAWYERSKLVTNQRLWEMARDQLRADLLALPQAEADANAGAEGVQYVPLMLEAEYGYRDQAPVTVTADSQTVRIGGRIDRLDLVVGESGEPVGFAVLDYKTSSSVPGRKELEGGQDLQLPLYIMGGSALLTDDGRNLPCHLGCYYQIRGGIAKRRSQIALGARLDRDSIVQAAVRHVVAFVRAIRSGIFPVMPGGEKWCGHCDFGTVCRHAPWRCRDKQRGAEVE